MGFALSLVLYMLDGNISLVSEKHGSSSESEAETHSKGARGDSDTAYVDSEGESLCEVDRGIFEVP